MSSTTGAAPAVGRVSAWALHLSALAIALLALGGLYAHSIAAAVTVWWVSPTFSHCFLIIPVSAYLIWGKRQELALLRPVAYPPALLFALPVIAMAFAGSLASINELEQLAVVAFAQILILALLGPVIYRAILFPCLFLFFLVPMGEYLIGPLQRFTTWFIDHGLTILGILHYTEGNLIQLANGAFQVAEACAGLRFLIATIAVGALFSYMNYRKTHKIVLFMLASVIVPIIGNGFRALGIVLLAHFSDNRIAVGADHLVYGWGFSVLILAVLMFVGMKFADEPKPVEPVRIVETRRRSSVALPATMFLALIAISLVPAFAAWRANTATAVDGDAFAAAPAISGWTRAAISHDWTPQYQSPDAKLEFALGKSDAPPVDVFVEYYAEESEGRNLISSSNKMWDEEVWHPISEGVATTPIGEQMAPMKELVLGSGGITRLIWWTYVSNGSFTTSAMTVKLNHVKTTLIGGQGAALLVVSTLVESDLDAARQRLRQAAAALGPVKARIDHAKHLAQR